MRSGEASIASRARCFTSSPPEAACRLHLDVRSLRVLTSAEREEISRGLAAGLSYRRIGATLARAPSTICREVTRHGGRRGYRASQADAAAWTRARRPKVCRLATHSRLRSRVAEKLAADWSPQQICGWLRRTYADDPTMQVSHETIYLSLFVQSRGVLKKSLLAICVGDGRCAGHAARRRPANSAGRSSMRCRSANVRPPSKTAPCRGIGRGTS